MMRQVRLASRRGLLLVEAVLSAVVIGVGLAAITRGFASHLRALRSIEESDALLALAQPALQEMEAQQSVPASGSGTFQPPYGAYEWTLSATPRNGPDDLKDAADKPLTSDVVLSVRRSDRPSSSAMRLTAVWPSEWVKQ